MFCKQEVAQLRTVEKQVEAAGGDIIVVGSGRVADARHFRETEKVSFRVLTDPSRRSYQAAGLRRDLMGTLMPSVLAHGIGALLHGFMQGRTQGDPRQQGGAFVFAAGGRELFHYVGKASGDHADPQALLAALIEQ